MSAGRRVLIAAGAAVLVAATSGCSFVSALDPRPVEIPESYKSYFTVAAKRCPKVLSPHGLAAQAYVESSFDPSAVSSAGAQGLMQILPEVWDEYGTDADGDGRKNPFSVPDSIATSAKISCDLADELKGMDGNKTELRLAAYNAGLSNVQRYDGIPPFPETENYVKRIGAYTDEFASKFASPSAPGSPSKK